MLASQVFADRGRVKLLSVLARSGRCVSLGREGAFVQARQTAALHLVVVLSNTGRVLQSEFIQPREGAADRTESLDIPR
jgi:hypothetical protein